MRCFIIFFLLRGRFNSMYKLQSNGRDKKETGKNERQRKLCHISSKTDGEFLIFHFHRNFHCLVIYRIVYSWLEIKWFESIARLFSPSISLFSFFPFLLILMLLSDTYVASLGIWCSSLDRLSVNRSATGAGSSWCKCDLVRYDGRW